MSDFKKNDNDSMSGYAENISKKDRYFEISYEDENGSGQGYISDDKLRFVIFCIENLAENMNVDPVIVHDALTRESDIVDQYIIPCYEMLHTQGKEHIVENLKEVMAERGIAL